MKRIFSWLVLLVVMITGVFWAARTGKMPGWMSGPRTLGGKTDGKQAMLPTATVTPRDIHFAVTAAGDIGPLDAVSVRPEIGGIIAKLTLDIGDRVKKSDVLFELDDKDLQTEKVSRKTEIAGAKLAVETQQLQLEKAKLNFERVKELFESKLVAQESFDNARIDHDLTKNSLDIAKNRLDTAQTALQVVEDKLLKTVIRAPFDCTILTRPVSVGQAVSGAGGFNSGTEVFTIANLAEMVITAHINQSDVTRLKVGQTVTVEVEAVPGLKLTGHVDRIAPQATFRTGIKGFATRIMLKDAEGAVRPGMTANLSIPLISTSNVLAVPLGAVFNEQSDRFVYVKQAEGQFERRPVQLGAADFDFVEVTKGLSAGEVVALTTPPNAGGAAPAVGKGGAASSAATGRN